MVKTFVTDYRYELIKYSVILKNMYNILLFTEKENQSFSNKKYGNFITNQKIDLIGHFWTVSKVSERYDTIFSSANQLFCNMYNF